MKGDYSRRSFDRKKRYTGVLKQQGRVDLDADWNESVEIQEYLRRIRTRDVIGLCGVPKTGGGFEIGGISTPDGLDFTISPGRMYVGGVLCEMDGDTTYLSQVDWPNPVLSVLESGKKYLVYLDVWKRHITAIEDPDIREPALGGPDTTTRLKTIRQVKVKEVGADVDCESELADWPPAPSRGLLTTQVTPSIEEENPCLIPVGGGYRGLENRLYRVEIHNVDASGEATFKWSKDNGSVVFPVMDFVAGEPNMVKVKRLGKDQVLALRVGDWAEVSDDESELTGQPGTLARIAVIDAAPDESGWILTMDTGEDLSLYNRGRHPKVRRWDQESDAIPVTFGIPIPLGDGIEIQFSGDNFRIGDYWVFYARTATGDVERLTDAPPIGVQHHYCRLALVTWQENEAGDITSDVTDCRETFPPLTDLAPYGCCIRVEPGEDLQRILNAVISDGGGCVCLAAGVHVVDGPLLLNNARNLTIAGVGMATALRLTGVNGKGVGGIVLENCAHVSIENLFVLGEDVPTLVDVYSGSTQRESHDLGLRSLTMVNISQSDEKTDIGSSAVRMTQAKDVQIEDCRLLAEVGILCLNDDSLPDVFQIPHRPVRLREKTILEFKEFPEGMKVDVGETFVSSEVSVSAKSFVTPDGDSINEGIAMIRAGGRGGNPGQRIMLDNINLGMDFVYPARELTLRMEHFGGNLNVEVNGEFKNVGSIAEIDGQTVGDVKVTAETSEADDSVFGTLTFAGKIDSFAVGGQKFGIDSVVLDPIHNWRPVIGVRSTGVRGLNLKDVVVRYRNFGVWAVTGEDWALEGCDIRPLGRLSRRKLLKGSSSLIAPEITDIDKAGWAGANLEMRAGNDAIGRTIRTLSSHVDVWRLLQHVDYLFNVSDCLNSGTAVKAFHWRDCTVKSCHLQGAQGLDVWWSFGGEVASNTVHVVRRGIHAFWLQDVRWTANKIRCVGGTGLSFGGSYRATISLNRVQGSKSLENVALTHELRELAKYVREIVLAYPIPDSIAPSLAMTTQQIEIAEQLALWIVLEESVRALGLEDLRDGVQDLFDGYRIYRYPVLYLASVYLHKTLVDPDLEVKLPMPIIGLTLNGNDMEGTAGCVLFDDFVTLGGMTVSDNRFHTTTGQAIRINTHPFAANVHLVILLWRALVKMALEGLTPAIAQVKVSKRIRDGMQNLSKTLKNMLKNWERQSESFLEADYRIEANTIRSMLTAIESNIFELAILDNHITMQERTIPNQEIGTLVNAFANVETMAPWAYAIRDGSTWGLTRAGENLATNIALLSNTKTRNEVSNAMCIAGTGISDASMSRVTTNLNDAVKTQDVKGMQEWSLKLAWHLRDFVSGHGIWVKGPGCRIVGNQVVVPADADPNTWARGGIQMWADPDDGTDTLIMIGLLLGSKIDPLLGLTETLIDNNEILGGIGHGIDIHETMVLFDLKIRDNQIRGMAGSGIFIDQETLAVGVDIEGNSIIDCSSKPALASLTDAKGGLVVDNAALCNIRSNRIRNCGKGQAELDVFGVDLESIYTLNLADNHIMCNGADVISKVNGGVRLCEVYGEVGVRDNEIPLNQGAGLIWDNIVTGFGKASPSKAAAPNMHIGGDNPGPRYWAWMPSSSSEKEIQPPQPGEDVPPPPQPEEEAPPSGSTEETTLPQPLFALLKSLLPEQVIRKKKVGAIIQGNRFEAPHGYSIPAFRLQGSHKLIFSGNSIDGASVIMETMGRGVVMGNVSSVPIWLRAWESVEDHHNIPPVRRI